MQSMSEFDIFEGRPRPARYRLIACEVGYRECCFATAVSRNVIDIHFLSQGLHDLESSAMSRRIQETVDATPAGRYGAILLGFGLCNNGLLGLTARDTPLVIPRVHDCIAMFLGSHEIYKERFAADGGTYYMTTGWAERDKDNLEDTRADEQNKMHALGLDKTFEEYAALYGEENARTIMASMGMGHYGRMGHIDMGLAPAVEDTVEAAARATAAARGWAYERIKGRMDYYLQLADGPPWDEARFLTLQPGQSIAQAYDDRVMRAQPESTPRGNTP